MNHNRTERKDEENSSFGLSEAALESIKPGFNRSEAKDRATAAGQAGNEDGHHRRRQEEKDIPQGSLAERIRKATKGS